MTVNSLGSGVTLLSALDDVRVTMLCTGIDEDDVGKHVKLSSTNNTVGLCTDGDNIFGILDVIEDRVVEGVVLATVVLAGGAFTATYDSGDAVAIGEMIVSGADTAATTIKRVASPTVFNKTIVVAKNASAGTVEFILRHP